MIYDTSSPDSAVTSAGYLSKEGAEVVQFTEKQLFPHAGIISDLTLPVFQYSTKKILQRIKPSIIHIHAIRTPLLIGLIKVAKQQGIPIVATLHSYKLLCPITHYVKRPEYMPCEKPYLNRHCAVCINYKIGQEHCLSLLGYKAYMSLIRRAYGQAKVLISISKTLHGLLQAIGYENVVYLPNPVSDDFLDSSKGPLGNERINIGFFGQLKDYKGVHFLSTIAKRFPNIDVRVAGWGPLHDWMIKKSNQYDNLILHGYIPRADLPTYVKSLNVVLVPSIYSEACPGVVLEAFAQRRPVVCFNLGGQSELVRLAKGGLLAKPFSVNDFCNKIENLISDPVKGAEFGLNGRKWVEQKCLPEKHGRALMDIYARVSSTS